MYHPFSGMVYMEDPLLLMEESSLWDVSSGLPLLLRGPLPYIQRHIPGIKMCSVRR